MPRALWIVLFSLGMGLVLSCEIGVDLNLTPSISISLAGTPIDYYIPVPEEGDGLVIGIEARKQDGSIVQVSMNEDSRNIDITALDQDKNPSIFLTDYNFRLPAEGGALDFLVSVRDEQNGEFNAPLSWDVRDSRGFLKSDFFDVVVPELMTENGGFDPSVPAYGSVKYLNPSGLREESDVRLDVPVNFSVGARRYMKVAGTAVPDDSGYTDRAYHVVIFMTLKGSERRYFTFNVNADNRFCGYLYFTETGDHDVYAFRMWNSHLYPAARGTGDKVSEGGSTLKFRINVSEAVPPSLVYLIPTRGADAGARYLREYAGRLVEGVTGERAIAKRIFEFLVYGDEKGAFEYTSYPDIAPGYLSLSYIDVFLASHFLANRRGVCNDFGELYAALCRAAGLNVQKVTGYTSDGSGGHMWNRVSIDGAWYRADATFANCMQSCTYFAEFYDGFDAAYFTNIHENTFPKNLTTEY